MNRLNVARVLEVVGQLTAPPPPEAPPMQGGWGDPGKEHDRSHYFRIVAPVGVPVVPEGYPGHGEDPGTVEVQSLCGNIHAECKPDELSDTDPLAEDNCTECRAALLKYRGLI